MITEWLAYQDLDGEKSLKSGVWKEERLLNIPNDAFFISNHDKSESYYFLDNAKTDLESLNTDLEKLCSQNTENKSISRTEYLQLLKDFKSNFDNYGVKKAIFSRIKLNNQSLEDAYSKYLSLCDKYKGKAFIYLVASEKFGVWMGATPEILIEREDNMYNTVSLAGTKVSEEQSWTEKEFEEQGLVTDFIEQKLHEIHVKTLKVGQRKTVFSGSVYHLKTKISFQYNVKDENFVINQLHPTPAVCGLPRSKAQEIIKKFETHDRKLYTGLIGWKKPDKSKIYVNLRCMQLTPKGYAVFVGGGITSSSIPSDEWDETEHKSKTLLLK